MSDHVFQYKNSHLEIVPDGLKNHLGGTYEVTKETGYHRSIQTIPDAAPSGIQPRNRSADYRVSKSKDPAEKVKELTDKLEQGIKNLFSSGNYQNYLKAMQKFHAYSYNNTMLIYMQKPDASYIAGYKTWETLHRHVKKGEKGISILAPCKYKSFQYADMIDPDTGQKRTDADGNPLKEKKEITRIGYKAVPIFDISQTEGEPLPELSGELKAEVPDYRILMESIRAAAPVPIRFDAWDAKKKGHYDLKQKEIVIRSGMSELQTLKTAVHETTHSILHTDEGHLKDPRTMEVEAESVAFVVCQHLGLDTSDYSFGYIAGWSSGKELPELKASLQTIQKTSHQLIETLDQEMLNYTNHLDISQTVADDFPNIPAIADTFHYRR